MFRLFSRSRRARRRVSSSRSAPVLQCGFARRTHENAETPSVNMYQSSGAGFSHAGAFREGVMNPLGFRMSDFNPLKMMQEIMKNDEGTARFKLDIKPIYFIVSIIAVITISTVMTLVFSTKGVTQGYKLRDLETKSQKLVRENEVMTMQLAQAQSLDAVVHNDVLLHMRPAKKITYMSGSSAIASR